MHDQIEWASSRMNSERLNGHALLFIISIMKIKLEMIGWDVFPHSIQKLFALLIIVESMNGILILSPLYSKETWTFEN